LQQTEVIIVGAGLAGASAAAMLGRADIDAVLIDPHTAYPPDFRCEKLDGHQVRVFEKTGLAEQVLPRTTPDREVWIARYGHVVERRPGNQFGFFYDEFVNGVRAQIPPRVKFIESKAAEIRNSDDRQTVTLSNGEELSARLVIVANGLNIGLRHKLGIEREVLSKDHSISIGFNVRPVGRPSFDFPALTSYGERTTDRIAYLTLFPIGDVIRANLFVYRQMQDPWLRQLRETPVETLLAVMPSLGRLMGGFSIPDFVKIRPIDLYISKGHRQPGVVLAGDAFSSSCPAAGTGALKALTDVERLCNVHIPQWLATPGMGAEKITAFYDDPVKIACENHSLDKAFRLRSFSIEPGLLRDAQRRIRFVRHWGRGTLRQVFDRRPAVPAQRATAARGAPSLGA
jgi:2-polyprenyl-6-methoxyphenol hydroxylase-like FAD-dependent oxidoreductase